jgi:hypothetical protein
MIFTYHEVKGLPIIIIDNYYDEVAADKIWQELCFLNNDSRKFETPEETGSAWLPNEDGEKMYLRKNLACQLDRTYRNRNASNILTENRKIFSLDLRLKLEDYHVYFRALDGITADGTIVNYYENADYYMPHTDVSVATVLTWFYKNPKSFTGGQLIIENELSIECLYNRTVIFPSMLKHAVEVTIVDSQLIGQNYGRYSITQLMSYKF